MIDNTWTLFLDRDGVINKRLIDNYVKHVDEFHFLDNCLEALTVFNKFFHKIIVVTNQQGIEKGIMTHEQLKNVHEHMLKEVERAGGRIDDIFYAHQLESENSIFRKPNIGMGILAYKKYPSIDFQKSIMVGDSHSDIAFGIRLGMKTIGINLDSQLSNHSLESLYELSKLLPNLKF